VGVRLRELLLLCSASALLACPCATPHPYYDFSKEPDPRKQEYVIGPSDVLRITVWRYPDHSGETLVRPDGTISLPLIGDLRAAGRTPSEVRAEITQRLSGLIKDASAVVTVAVVTINSYRFTVSGNVEHPGTFTANHYVTLTEAVALAGGPNRYASPEDTVIMRADAARGVRRILIDYPAILAGTHPEQDLPLLAGDTIYVP
jgi:polysaccharide export outer membrane protein